jgi:hypothetical protein
MSHTDSYPTHKKDLELYNEVLNFRQSVARLITYDNDEGTDTLSHFARRYARDILKHDEVDFGIMLRDLPRTAYDESEYTDE